MIATLATPASNAIANPTDDRPLSPWWLRTIVIVMVFGFAVLIAITALAYRNAPPIPHIVADSQGTPLFTDADIGDGQAVFLKYGLMDNGSIWGHGAYLGPDYSAEALHWMGEDTAAPLAQTQFDKQLGQLDLMQRAGLQAEVALVLKTNRYDPVTGVLTLTAAEAQAWRQQIGYWADYFKLPAGNGGLKPNLISDPAETSDEALWASIEKYIKTAFFGTNIGLAMMVMFSLFPSGVLQVWDVVQHGYWHARSLDYVGSERSHLIEWLRLPGDLVFIIFGAIPLVVASIKGYFGVRADTAQIAAPPV